MLAADGLLCVAGQSGSIICIPLASLAAGGADGAFELRAAGSVGRLLAGFFARCGCFPATRRPLILCTGSAAILMLIARNVHGMDEALQHR